MTDQNAQNGFTLIELLLVVGLLALSVGITSDILISLVRSYSKSQVINEIEQNANFVSQKLEKELRNAANIDAIDTDTTLNDLPGGSSITFTDRKGDQIVYRLNTSTGRIQKKVNAGNYVNLTPDPTTSRPNISNNYNFDDCFFIYWNRSFFSFYKAVK